MTDRIVSPREARAARLALASTHASALLALHRKASQGLLGPDAVVVLAHRADVLGSQFATEIDHHMQAHLGRRQARILRERWGDLVLSAISRTDAATLMAEANPEVSVAILAARPGVPHALIIAFQGSTFLPLHLATRASLGPRKQR